MQVKDEQAGGSRETARAASGCCCSWGGRGFDISSIIYDPEGASVRVSLCVCACVYNNTDKLPSWNYTASQDIRSGGLGCCSWASSKLIGSPAILNGAESVRSGCNGVREKKKNYRGKKINQQKHRLNVTGLVNVAFAAMDSVQSPGFLKQTKGGFQAQTEQETEGEEATSDKKQPKKKNQDLPPPYISLLSRRRKTTAGIMGKERGKKKKNQNGNNRRTRATLRTGDVEKVRFRGCPTSGAPSSGDYLTEAPSGPPPPPPLPPANHHTPHSHPLHSFKSTLQFCLANATAWV